VPPATTIAATSTFDVIPGSSGWTAAVGHDTEEQIERRAVGG
jgi:hypothetical protein